MIDVLMADDHPIFRSGVRRLLSDEADMRVVAEASNGQEALELLTTDRFGVVLLDVNMGGRNGLETLRRIRLEWPQQPVIMLSMYPEEQYASIALAAGANAYLSKDRNAGELVSAIRIAGGGGYYLPPGMSPGVLTRGAQSQTSNLHQDLSQREWQILRLIVKGISLTEIGASLCLSVKTISTYRTRLLTKLKVDSNAELVRYSLLHGLDE